MHRFFDKPETIKRLHRGPLGDHLDRYADWLVQQGFGRASARLHLVQLADFSRWLMKRRLTLIDIDLDVIELFLEDRRRRVRPHAERLTLQRFLRLVRPGWDAQQAPLVTASRAILQDFGRYLMEDRGAAEVSCLSFEPIIHQFILDRFPGEKIDFERLAAEDVVGFVRRHAFLHSPGRARLLTTALRSFLRFLYQQGKITHDLASVVPRVAMWQGSTVPKFLSSAQVHAVLAHCNRDTAIGKRNYAILLLLSRLGLRADEIVRLSLDEIDWDQGHFTFRGKGGHWSQMPLPADVGQAIASYLQHGRPASDCRRLFLRHSAPRVGFKNSGAISTIARRAIVRARVNSRRKGSHLFRHSLATRMIHEGASLEEIAELLRHRSIETTNIYAKVDFQALQSIALPWIGGER
jgi:site-specific recombinase XerD